MKNQEVVLMGFAASSGIDLLGHEFIGTVVKVTDSEKKWKVGDRVGGPW